MTDGKSAQLRQVPMGTIRCLFVGDHAAEPADILTEVSLSVSQRKKQACAGVRRENPQQR